MDNYEIRTFANDRFEMEYMVFGSGPVPLVILPGISVRSVLAFAPFIVTEYKGFTESHTVYLFDRKKNIRPGYSVGDMAEDTAEAMKAIGVTGADVFGASQGGMIAMCLAVRQPECVGRLVLGSTAAEPNATLVSVLEVWKRLAREGRAGELYEDMFRHLYSKPYFEKCRRTIPILCREVDESDLRRFIMLCNAALDVSLRERLKDIRCPTLVLGAENDAVLTGQASRDIAAAIGCDCHLYGDGYGHGVFDEAKDFKARLATFFRR